MKRDKNILLSKKKGKVLKMETRKSLFSDKQKLIPKFNDDSFKKKNKTDNFQLKRSLVNFESSEDEDDKKKYTVEQFKENLGKKKSTYNYNSTKRKFIKKSQLPENKENVINEDKNMMMPDWQNDYVV